MFGYTQNGKYSATFVFSILNHIEMHLGEKTCMHFAPPRSQIC